VATFDAEADDVGLQKRKNWDCSVPNPFFEFRSVNYTLPETEATGTFERAEIPESIWIVLNFKCQTIGT